MTRPTDRSSRHVQPHPGADRAGEAAATAAEYAFVLLFIAIAAIIGMVVLGQGMADLFTETGETVGSTEVPAIGDGAGGG